MDLYHQVYKFLKYYITKLLGQKTISEYMYHTNETSFISKNSNIPETENFGTVRLFYKIN